MGSTGVYPPIKSEEWESGWESVGCGRGVFKSAQVAGNEVVADGPETGNLGKSAQVLWNEGVADRGLKGDSKRRAEFTKECSTHLGTCQ
jgi:hypothetical protein